MLPFLLRRLLQALPVLLGVTFLVVAATKLVPGSPGELKGQKLSRAEVEAIDRKYGYDRPVLIQLGRYVGRLVLERDLGECWIHGRPVRSELKERFPATIELAVSAMTIATVLGLVLGTLAALRPRGIVDHAIAAGALTGISLPIFWLGILLQLIWPMTQRIDYEFTLEGPTGFFVIDAALARDSELFVNVVQHLALPAFALATIPLATITRLTRASLIEALQQDYVRTARAKGLSPGRVVVKHALRNALIPIVTALGLQLAALLGGAVLTESVFQWPGVGSYIVEAAINKDLPALQGAVLVVAVVYMAANIAVDASYGLIDPRVRVE